MIGLFMLMMPHTAVLAQTNEIEMLKQQMKALQAQLEAMQERLEAVDESVAQNAQAVEATAEAVESQGSRSSFWDNTSMGGYGELHYNNWNRKNGNDLERLDFHRFVLFFGHEFTDRLRFFSEFELEHALAGDGEDKPGEVELEQAFVEYDFDERNSARAGIFLLPVGILNETHEPPTFYGVERNTVENVIIPTTWWAGGVGYTHRSDMGITFDLALHEGLEMEPTTIKVPDPDDEPAVARITPRNNLPFRPNQPTNVRIETLDASYEIFDTARIRSGRQKTANATASDLAVTGRIKYTGMPGLELAASLQYQSDMTQESDDAIDDGILYEAHVVFNRGPFGLRALYAGWDLDVDSRIEVTDPNDAKKTITVPNPVKADDYDQQEGWYIEPSFKLTPNFGIFARYEDVEGGRASDEFEQWSLGFNYWLNEDAVLKFDFVDREHDNAANRGGDFDGFNLGVGYEF